MNRVNKLAYSTASALGALALSVGSAFAQTFGTASLSVSTTLGDLGGNADLAVVFRFAFNLLRWLGWAGVILGVGFAIVALIYKLFNTDNEEAMKTVQGYLTKAVLIVIAGILLISAGFLVQFVGNIFGVTGLSVEFTSGTVTGS